MNRINSASLLFRSAPTQPMIGLAPVCLSTKIIPFNYNSMLLASMLKALEIGDVHGFFDGLDCALPVEVTCDSIRVRDSHIRFVLTDGSRQMHPGDIYAVSRLTEEAFGDIALALSELLHEGLLDATGDGWHMFHRDITIT